MATSHDRLSRRLQSRLDSLDGVPIDANLHSVVVASGKEVLVQRHFPGNDERWGEPLGVVDFGPDTLHDLRSITKSIVSLLYGIALHRGAVPGCDELLVNHFDVPDRTTVDRRLAQMTVSDALTMRLGLRWDESLPYSDPRNDEHAMERAGDRSRFVLEQPFEHEPGTLWCYSGGATALVASLLERGTGSSLQGFAREHLFDPLDITSFEWVTDSRGDAVPASGLRMRPVDLARLGQLLLNGGRYQGRSVVPERWLRQSLMPHARVDDDLDYGYHWWVARRWNWWAAFGNGGQRLTVLPRADLVLVVTAGNYNQADAWKVPVQVLVDVVLPSLREPAPRN